MSKTTKYTNFSTGEKVFFIGLIIWILLQMSRFIAKVLIDDIHAGGESFAWLYPAYLDMFAAFLALPLIAAIIAKRGLFTWTMVLVYLAISIVDHFGNFTTTTFVGPPSIVEEGSSPYLIPVIQTVLDFLFLGLLFVPSFRKLFFKLDTEHSA